MVTYLQYGMTIFATSHILSLLEWIRKSDLILERIGYRFKYKAGFIINFTVISFGMYFIGFNIGLEIWNSPRENVGTSSVFESIVIGWPQFLIHLVESMFILSNLLLYTRFFAINLIMETLFVSNGGREYLREPPSDNETSGGHCVVIVGGTKNVRTYQKGFHGSRQLINFIILFRVSVSALSTIQKYPKRITNKIELFFQIYFYLNKAGDKLKEINQMRFLALFAGLFLINICTLFNAYYEYYIKEDIYSAINWFQWTSLVWIGFALLCFTCHLTVNEARRTGILLHKLLLEDLNPELSEKMLLFSNHISNTKLEYNACGFFSIDGTLFYMLVGATFNYMIIMLQFEEGNNEVC
ncbi:uncharacterized protein LOC123307157 [Coccinella septempunctata]|uniref:uncharacterized protein LOC123307157 n=1 Tax=Coccinella septempunctata TaxID=41139 RepID=UPI001D064513|nr:uncharacterized protein LOC123307157 [Coccinella septempunctata]